MISVEALSLAVSPHHRRPSSLGALPPPPEELLPHHWAAAGSWAAPMKRTVKNAIQAFIRFLLNFLKGSSRYIYQNGLRILAEFCN